MPDAERQRRGRAASFPFIRRRTRGGTSAPSPGFHRGAHVRTDSVGRSGAFGGTERSSGGVFGAPREEEVARASGGAQAALGTSSPR
jgi:hypothetical protein